MSGWELGIVWVGMHVPMWNYKFVGVAVMICATVIKFGHLGLKMPILFVGCFDGMSSQMTSDLTSSWFFLSEFISKCRQAGLRLYVLVAFMICNTLVNTQTDRHV